jgi:hypothetical protein
MVKRGDVWLVNLDPTVVSEIKKVPPLRRGVTPLRFRREAHQVASPWEAYFLVAVIIWKLLKK